MAQKNDPSQARYLRKAHKDNGYDQEEEHEDKTFKEDFEKALKNHSKKATTHSLENQIEYFGYAIEPFNMREEEEMGDIDEEGYFVFKRKNKNRDAWLESINNGEQGEEVDRLKKKIKDQGRFQNVYQADRKLNEDYREQQDQVIAEQQNEDEQEEQKDEVLADEKLTKEDIKMLLASKLPFNSNANKHLKLLKKEKRNGEYEQILELCNQYIELTEDHGILTMKKQQLQDDGQEQQEGVNWDQEEHGQQKGQAGKMHVSFTQKAQVPILQKKGIDARGEGDEDDIF